MKVIKEGRLPIKMWVTDIEDSALDQAKNLANLPFAYKHISLMPDTHFGFGAPIGSVFATKGVVIPFAVGSDIGCGMVSVKTSILVKDFKIDQLKQIMGLIRKTIPVGFIRQKEKIPDKDMPWKAEPVYLKIVSEEWESARTQLGTLGGGNHFVEIQKGSDGFIWIMIHSGSRNLGYKVAIYYNNLAKELNKKWHTSVPKEHDLSFLPLDTKEGQEYLEEMKYCLEFAQANRDKMMESCKNAFQEVINEVKFNDLINIHHNYASLENHFGENVMIHRKGATSARLGEIGIIPGSQGTSSYIVEGLGNPESFQSCSHGAGRKMGRKQAERTLDLEYEKNQMKGILHSLRGKSDLDEAPGAYKDIKTVMENQKDLVKILIKLIPMGVIKG